MLELLRRLFRTRLRTRGEPTSPNRASSFHVWWQLPTQAPLVEVSAVIEVVDRPVVSRLYFWALQASFTDGRTAGGGAHIGLQHHPDYPGSSAVNWGGYAAPADGGAVLDGSVSNLPSALDNANTRDFPWSAGRTYRLRIYRSPDPAPQDLVAWRGEIEDVASGQRTVIRDLYGKGRFLAGPVVWSEVFARCDHPPAAVRWSDLRAVTEDGAEVAPARLRVTYQSAVEGGCDNTNVAVTAAGVVQRTNAARVTPSGTVLDWPAG